MQEVITIVFLFLLTPICFFISKHTQTHILKTTFFNPILVSIVVISIILVWADIPYEHFAKISTPFTWLLELAIVALAIPLYKEARNIKKQTWQFLLSSMLGVFVSSNIAMFCAYLFNMPKVLILSLAPNAVTTPIAIEVSAHIGGIPALSAVIVICVGIFGAVIGLPLLKLFSISNPKAQGIAIGAACHAVGTARAVEVNEQMGAFASVSLILSAILTPLIIPLNVKIMQILHFVP